MDKKAESTDRENADRRPYEKPTLKRWGNLRELTQGGGGRNKEAVAPKKKTRF